MNNIICEEALEKLIISQIREYVGDPEDMTIDGNTPLSQILSPFDVVCLIGHLEDALETEEIEISRIRRIKTVGDLVASFYEIL